MAYYYNCENSVRSYCRPKSYSTRQTANVKPTSGSIYPLRKQVIFVAENVPYVKTVSFQFFVTSISHYIC